MCLYKNVSKLWVVQCGGLKKIKYVSNKAFKMIELSDLFQDGKEKNSSHQINLSDYHLFIRRNLYLYIFLPFAIAKTSP